MPKADTSAIDEKVFMLLMQTYAVARKTGEKAIAGLGLTLAEYSFLRIVEKHAQITAAEARKRLFLSAPSIAQLIAALEQKGFIVRHPHATDARRLHIALTSTGKTQVKAARSAIQAALKKTKLTQSTLKSALADLTSLHSSLSTYGN